MSDGFAAGSLLVIYSVADFAPALGVPVGLTPIIRAGYKSVYYTPDGPVQFVRLYRP
jgi:hypothetical protein